MKKMGVTAQREVNGGKAKKRRVYVYKCSCGREFGSNFALQCHGIATVWGGHRNASGWEYRY